MIISVSGGHELLQMVSKLNIEQCASEDLEPQRELISGGVSEDMK